MESGVLFDLWRWEAATMAADSNETFVDVEVREGILRTEKIFRAFVTGAPDCPKNGLVTEFA
jgi:hypothetical protein